MSYIFAAERVTFLENKKYIFDVIRKKNLICTPEELVRQNIIDYLLVQKKYSKNLIKLESSTKFNKLLKRSDILIYDNKGRPFLLIECKAPHIKLSNTVIQQVSIYNSTINAQYIAISNGTDIQCFKLETGTGNLVQITDFPNPDLS